MAHDEKTSPKEHPQCGSRPRRGGRVRLALLLILVYALSPLGHYGIPKKSSIFDDEISPSGKYRVEFYHPRYCPYAYLVYRHPFFFRVYNTEKRRYVYTSNIDTLLSLRGFIVWPEDEQKLAVSFGLPDIPEEELQ